MTIAELRQKCQPAHKKLTDPLMEWYLLRPISIYVTWVCVRLGLQSNHVTFLGVCCGAAGSGLLLLGDMSWALPAAAFLWLGFLLDCVDGEVARYRGKGSIRGAYCDYLAGGVNDAMCLLGLGFFVSAVTGWDPRWTVVPSVMLAVTEKLVGLYVHSAAVRCAREAWDGVEADPAVDYDAAVWFAMPLRSRLLRVPFETFFRVTVILLATTAGVALDQPSIIVACWAGLLGLSLIVTGKGAYSEIFQNRVETTSLNFARALKSRAQQQKRAA